MASAPRLQKTVQSLWLAMGGSEERFLGDVQEVEFLGLTISLVQKGTPGWEERKRLSRLTLRNSAVLLGPEASKHIGREGKKAVFLSLSHWAFGDTLRWGRGTELVSFKIFKHL